MLFFGAASFPPLDEFVSTLLLTAPGQGLLVTATVVGAVFAAMAYSVSVIAAPMMFDRKVDAVTAMMASVRAVRTNLPAMALWAVLIAALSVAGMAFYFVGLAITFPLAAMQLARLQGFGPGYARAASTFGLASAWRTASGFSAMTRR